MWKSENSLTTAPVHLVEFKLEERKQAVIKWTLSSSILKLPQQKQRHVHDTEWNRLDLYFISRVLTRHAGNNLTQTDVTVALIALRFQTNSTQNHNHSDRHLSKKQRTSFKEAEDVFQRRRRDPGNKAIRSAGKSHFYSYIIQLIWLQAGALLSKPI